MEASILQTDPFPFVPATWMALKPVCGLSNKSQILMILSSLALYALPPMFWN